MPNQHLFQPDWLSKYARLADWVMSRPGIQEEAVSQLANLPATGKIPADGLAGGSDEVTDLAYGGAA